MTNKKISKIIFNRQKVSLVFLGVGITMFLINMTSIITLLPYVEFVNQAYGTNFLGGYYISVISSIILMTYSLYNLFIE